jgi:hypothetical protein
MSTIVLRSVKGSPLTNAEVDSNFTNLNNDKTELGGTYSSGTANGVLFLSASKVLTTGSALTFSQSGGTFSTTFNINSLLGSPTYKGGIVVTEDDAAFTLYGGSNYKLLETQGFSTPTALKFFANNAEQMRLTSTGLGIGTSSPTQKLTVVNSAGIVGANSDTLTSGAYLYLRGDSGLGSGQGAIAQINASYGLDIWGYNSGWQKNLTLTASGNLGLGVTPSAWTSFTALQMGETGCIASNAFSAANTQTFFGNNVYYDGAYKYISTGSAAAQYIFIGNEHRWNIAPSGTAGDAISFSQAMTLDASGNLGVGETSPSTYAALAVKDKGGNGTIAAISATNVLYIKNSGTVASITYNDAYPLTFGTNNTERARITAAGNFVIGGTSGSQRITSVGNIKIAGAQASNVAQLIFTRTDASWSNNNETDLRWYSGAGDTDTPATIRMTLSSADGNLLVGSTGATGSTMLKALSNVASGGTDIAVHNFNDSGGGVTYAGINFIVGSDSGTSAIRSIRTNSGVDFQTALQFLTNPTGPTTTPTVKLTLSSGGNLAFNQSSNLTASGFLNISPSSTLVLNSDDTVQFKITGSERARIDSSGNFLLGGTVAANSTGGMTITVGAAGAVSTPIALRNPSTASGAGVQLSFRGSSSVGAENDYAYIGMVADDTTAKTGSIRFSTANGSSPVERARIDSSGNFGIGTSSPAYALHVQRGAGVASYIGAAGNNNDLTTAGLIVGQDSSGLSRIYQFGSNPITLWTANLERARIDSSGNLLVGTTTMPFSSFNRGVFSFSIATGSGGEGGIVFVNTNTSVSSDPNPAIIISKGSTTTSSAQRFIQFSVDGNTQPMGGIVGNGATNVQFVSLSDVREKTNITPINGSLEKVIALNPVEFDWIANGEHCPAGFVAQDVEKVFPEFVVENIANEGQEPRKGLTGGMTGGIVAHLVKAIQEQQALIQTLTARVAALESI